MDDFSIFGTSFAQCLHNLNTVLENFGVKLGEVPLYGVRGYCVGSPSI